MAKMKLADQVALVERFLNENFALRYNEVRDTFEFKVLNPEMGVSLTNTDFVPLQDEALNSIILEAMKAVPDWLSCVMYCLPGRGEISGLIPAHSRSTRMYGVTDSTVFQTVLQFMTTWKSNDKLA